MPIEVKRSTEIKVDQIEIPSPEPEEDKSTVKKFGFKTEPLISINGKTVEWEYVTSFLMKSHGFIPKIQLAFYDQYELFSKEAAIKNGDLVSIYIREPNSEYKPIRMDFYITNGQPTSNQFSESSSTIYIKGIAHIPSLWEQISDAIDGSSLDTLEKISEKTKLGYATNINSSNDSMTWISPYYTYYEWIQDIVTHAYLDNDSFFTSFVDFYYNLNYVELNQEFPSTLKLEKFDPINISQGEFDETSEYTLLTNLSDNIDNGLTFNSPVLIDKSGKLSIHDGYNKKVYYYSYGDDQLVDFKIEPLTTQENQEMFNRRGRLDDEYYKKMDRNINVGIQFDNGNVHSDYQFSTYQNKHNLIELDKTQLQIDIPVPNISLYRFQKLSILFMRDLTGSESYEFNPYLSGNYIINNITFVKLDNGNLGQRLQLTRREWPVDLKIKS